MCEHANILVVDDTPENLSLLIGILSENGYEVRPASDGEFAIQSAQATPPDVILLDVKMPGIDGYEVCRRLKADEQTRDIPVIFISALSETEDKVRGFEVGGLDYITKPFQAQEILARVQTHLQLYAFQRNLQQEIIKRQQIEEELRALNQRLRDANASKDTFFSIIAHDLRNPFTSLIGLTGLLVEEFDSFDSTRIETMLGRVHASAKNLYALLTNLLDWSRLQRGIIEFRPDKTYLRHPVEHCVEFIRPTAEAKQIHLSSTISSEIVVYADPAMLKTILRNLLSNAVKFTPPGGTIEVSAQTNARMADISVTDSGMGMSPVMVEQLFHIEHKLHREGTAGEEGTGLGLILCQELIQKHGGMLRVESELGKGSRFIAAFPRWSAEAN